MIRVALLVALASAVSLGAAPTARAWTAPGQFAADPGVQELADRGLAFWRQHDLRTCPDGPTIWQVPGNLTVGTEGAWGAGDGATCEMWISASLARVVVGIDESSFGGMLDACTAVTHEVGHALGLPHSARGVMAGAPYTNAPPHPHAWAPPFCHRWARFNVRALLRGDGETDRQIRHDFAYWYAKRPPRS